MLGGLVSLATLITLLPAEAPARTRPGVYDRSGVHGSGQAVVQPVTLGVRVGLVGAVPGSSDHEAWAVGRSTAKVGGWAGERGGGQTVFLRYTRTTGWRLQGPPRARDGSIANPTITALSFAPDGDGWAVGGSGALVRLTGGTWTMTATPTDASLSSVSVTNSGGRTIGYAIGGATVLRYDGSAWLPEPFGFPEDDIDLRSVSVAPGGEAWIAGRIGRAALIARRTDSGWTRVMTGREMFDGDATRAAGTTVIATTPANTIAASRTGTWVGGAIVPVDAATAQASAAGDPTRPFALFIARDGKVTSFCPDRYAMGSNGRAETTALCDEPFPLAAFGLSTMQVFPGPGRGEVFAGGLGLFHYRDGAWFREPDPVSYVSAMGFVNRTEGWFAGTGGTTAATGAVSTLQTIAHWTRSPSPPRMARHPQPMTDPFTGISHPVEAVAIAPDGSGEALAVGRAGAMLRHVPEVGWDTFTPVTALSLHAVAYRSAREAWAVGGRGFLAQYRDGVWRQAGTDAPPVTTASLFGVAFAGESRGYAVGANGTILRFDGSRWRHDPASRRVTDADLFAIARAGDEFVAVGADGTIVETRGSAWRRVADVGPVIGRGGLLPALYSVAGLPDGTAVAGGELSTLIRRDGASGAWRVDRQGGRVPPEGTILAVAARRRGSQDLDLIVSVAQDALKYAGEIPAATTGVVLYGTSGGWQDLDGRSRETLFDSFDASATRDPVLAIAFDGSGAWAVGGIGPGNDDGQGHIQGYPTSSIYRIEPSGDPHPTGFRTTPAIDPDPNLISFAFFGESSCGRGLCGATVGTGTMADVVSGQIRDEINRMSGLPGGPAFAVFGGNMRRSGIPEELGEFKHFAKGFRVPLFAALGGNDLFTGIEAPGLLPEQVSPDHSFYVDTFRDRPAPWGEARPHPGFVPVFDDPSAEGARTHYAFDYAPGGTRKLRVIVLDDSAPARLSTAATQNPPRDQSTWLTDALRDARDRSLPAIIVMNRPARNPLDLGNPETSYDEALPVQAAAANVGASAVLTSYFRENAVLMASVGDSGTVPVYVFGGGGAPLEAKPDSSPPVAPEPAQGYYHSWQMVTVDLSRRTALGQAEVSVQSFPVVDGLALHAIDGVTVPGGNTLRFTSSGRTPEGGGPADPLQSRAAVIPMDFRTRGVCAPDASRGFRPRCRTTGPVGPAFRYESEDPSVGFFVTPSAANDTVPAIDPATDLPIPDPSSGLFCAVGGGTTYVSVVSGFHRARMQVTVTSGEGPCTKKKIEVRPVRNVRPPVFVAPPEQPVVAAKPFGFHFAPEQQTSLVLPPPPITVAAPAPPGAGGYAKKEEHETAPEQANEDHHFTALPRRVRNERDAERAWLVLGGAFAVSFWSAVAAAAVYRRRTHVRPEELFR